MNTNNQSSETDIKAQIGQNVKEYNSATMIDSNYTGPVQPIAIKKVRNKAIPFLLLALLLFGGAALYQYRENQKLVNYYTNEYSPIASKKETVLELDDPLVRRLYNMVETTGGEDYANPNFDTNLKRYLAYKYLSNRLLNYKSNCNNFDSNKMMYYSCNDDEYTPTSFKVEDLEVAFTTLFGDNHEINHDNIQLGNECIGGFEYIPERGEYVQGKCTRNSANLVNVDKKLTGAKSTESHIYLEEEVRYYPTDNNQIPKYLNNGKYKYTFKLDRHYNYVYVNREFIG